jgi:endo-1,4-beta-D-glucanase Y
LLLTIVVGGCHGTSAPAGVTGSGGGGGGDHGSGGAPGSDGGPGGDRSTDAAAPIAIPGTGSCTAPAGARTDDARAAYAKWKTDLVTGAGAGGFRRVRRPNSSGAEVNSTVSEGIAYGMLLAAYNDDQPLFDDLWRYEQLWLDPRGLMNWYINAAGTAVNGTGAATDADEDMAFALVVAAARWGGQGALPTSYQALAAAQINLIWQYEVDHGMGDVLTPGDQFGGGQVINISYFAPAFYRVFGRVTNTTASWNNVVASTYRVLTATLNARNGNTSNGLVPAWSTPDGTPMAPAGTSMPTWHQLDSCRTPFRLAQDYCWFGDASALAYLQAISGFYAGVGARNLVDGYDLNGTPHPQFASVGNQAAAFVGTAGAGAMAVPSVAAFRDDAYADVATLSLLAGSQYYNESWTALSLLMMTGGMAPP